MLYFLKSLLSMFSTNLFLCFLYCEYQWFYLSHLAYLSIPWVLFERGGRSVLSLIFLFCLWFSCFGYVFLSLHYSFPPFNQCICRYLMLLPLLALLPLLFLYRLSSSIGTYLEWVWWRFLYWLAEETAGSLKCDLIFVPAWDCELFLD